VSPRKKLPHERPVSVDIRRAAARAGIAERGHADGSLAGVTRGDAAYVVAELSLAFDAIIDAESMHHGGERDARVFGALKRLRNAGTIIGGAS